MDCCDQSSQFRTSCNLECEAEPGMPEAPLMQDVKNTIDEHAGTCAM